MKNFKRIISFMMAMVICASFCLVNGSAARVLDYTVGEAELNPGVTSAYAIIDITEWPQDTGHTDLYAETGAYLSEYFYPLGERFHSFSAYVDLSIELEDYSNYGDDLEVSSDNDDIFVTVYGEPLLCGEPYYAIINLGSKHYVTVYEYSRRNEYGDWCDPQPWQDGDTVYFGISQ